MPGAVLGGAPSVALRGPVDLHPPSRGRPAHVVVLHSAASVSIGDAASLVGITPRAIRHHHEIGLLPEPERGSDDRRRCGSDEMIRLLWIRTMTDAGIALDDTHDASAATAGAGTGACSDNDVTGVLGRLATAFVGREAGLQRQRTAVQRMRTRGSVQLEVLEVALGRGEEGPPACDEVEIFPLSIT